MIRVMLVDDQLLVREGIKSLLSLSDEVDVVAEASNGESVVEQSLAAGVDVILMDIRMPKVSGIEGVQQLAQACVKTPVIMLTTFDDHTLVLEAVEAGAKGYLLKDVSLETLVEGIKQVHAGHTLIQPAITESVLKGMESFKGQFDSAAQTESLTEKEKEILRLVAAGYSNREIAAAMFKSEGTVKNQVSAVLAKLGVRDRTRAVLKALDIGLI